MESTKEPNSEPVDKIHDSEANEGRWTKRSFWLCTLHIFTLCSLALAKPLFDVTAKDAAFYVVRGSRPVDIISLVLVLSFLFPAALALVEWLAGLVIRRLQLLVHYLFVFILVALYGAQFLKHAKILDGLSAIALIAAVGCLGTVLYARTESCRRLVSLASPIIVLFPLIFIFGSPVGQVVKPHWLATAKRQDTGRHLALKKKPPIVFVLMDELPVVSLMDAQGNIDVRRFPNLAEFARTATWFRNTMAVSAQTTTAVPAILTGVFPTKVLLPNLADHPDNLFTLLGNDYKFNVFESATFLCPPALATRDQETQPYAERMSFLFSDLSILYLHVVMPQKYLKNVPSIDNQWGNFRRNRIKLPHYSQGKQSLSNGKEVVEDIEDHLSADRPAFFRRFVEKTGESSKDSLNFVHVMLPHNPMEYLPSGKKHSLRTEVTGVSRIDDRFIGPQGLVDQYNYRHLLQMACMDRLIGELISQLKTRQLFDDALIILVADHGASFMTNDYNRRLSRTNAADLMFVPLLIKTPGQKAGGVSDTAAQTVDILPTIADVLGIELPWKPSGSSLFAAARASSPTRLMMGEDGSVLSFSYAQLLAERDKALARNVELFGLADPRSTLFWFGKYRGLMGKPLSAINIVKGTDRIDVDQTKLFEAVDLNSNYVPAKIGGRVFVKGKNSALTAVAISVNGVIQGVADTYPKGADAIFSTVIPDSSFVQGYNKVEFFLVATDGKGQHQLVSSNQQSPVYQLGNGEILDAGNRRVPILAGALNGKVEALAINDDYGKNVQISGWAANTGKAKLVDAILVFADGKFIDDYRTTEVRPDVSAAYKENKIERCGFRYLIPRDTLPHLHNIRLFALSDGIATELEYDKSLGLEADYSKKLHNDGLQFMLNERAIVTSKGETFPLIPGKLQGTIDAIEQKEQGIVLTGWTADAKQGRPVDEVLVFADGAYLGSGKTLVPRPDVAKAWKKAKLATCGFDFLLPAGSVKDMSHLRIFAVSQGIATELANPLSKPSNNDPEPGTLDSRVTYSLGTDRIVPANGNPLQLYPSALQGSLDIRAREGDRIRIAGWAASIEQSRPADQVLIFADGKFAGSGKLNMTRPDVGKANKNQQLDASGFEYLLPVRNIGDLGAIRVFAVVNGTATELPYAGDALSNKQRKKKKK